MDDQTVGMLVIAGVALVLGFIAGLLFRIPPSEDDDDRY